LSVEGGRLQHLRTGWIAAALGSGSRRRSSTRARIAAKSPVARGCGTLPPQIIPWFQVGALRHVTGQNSILRPMRVRTLAASTILAFLGGCALFYQDKLSAAQSAMTNAALAYQNCMNANHHVESMCPAEREAYERARAAFTAAIVK
jgi:hypothetical protein